MISAESDQAMVEATWVSRLMAISASDARCRHLATFDSASRRLDGPLASRLAGIVEPTTAWFEAGWYHWLVRGLRLSRRLGMQRVELARDRGWLGYRGWPSKHS